MDLTAAAAEATHRVRLGPLVTCVAFRNPALLARMVAVSDIVSGGRIELGLGAGWNEGEARAYGFRLGPLRERMDRFAEALEVLHSLFTREQTDFEGRYFTLVGARIDPKPVQLPHPPFVIGGIGEQRTIPLVARWAQQWNVGPVKHDMLVAKRAVLERECDRIGRDPGSIELSCNVTLRPDSDMAKLAARAHSYAELGVDRVIVTISDPSVTPAILEPLAAALAAEGACTSTS